MGLCLWRKLHVTIVSFMDARLAERIVAARMCDVNGVVNGDDAHTIVDAIDLELCIDVLYDCQ